MGATAGGRLWATVMRTTATAIAILFTLAGCAAKKPAEEPENTEDTASSDESSKSTSSTDKSSDETTLGHSVAGSSTGGFVMGRPADKATIKDDTEKQAAPCNGMAIPDLLASLSQAACELPEGAAPSTQHVQKDNLDVTLTASGQVAPGSSAQVSVVFKNKGKTKLPLDFTVDPDPRFHFELYTPKGARVDKPAGNEPPLPPGAGEAIAARLARITLYPNGTATLLLPWQAVKYKWVSKDKAKGAVVGHGYPREPAGPLPKGKYVLRLVMPLANADETGDHEVSQPRADVEIAGAVVEASPPPSEAPKKAPEPAASAAAPAGSASEAAVESKFLKAVGTPGASASAAASDSQPAKPAKKKK
jgi:predicted small lipoprotein YifL